MSFITNHAEEMPVNLLKTYRQKLHTAIDDSGVFLSIEVAAREILDARPSPRGALLPCKIEIDDDGFSSEEVELDMKKIRHTMRSFVKSCGKQVCLYVANTLHERIAEEVKEAADKNDDPARIHVSFWDDRFYAHIHKQKSEPTIISCCDRFYRDAEQWNGLQPELFDMSELSACGEIAPHIPRGITPFHRPNCYDLCD